MKFNHKALRRVFRASFVVVPMLAFIFAYQNCAKVAFKEAASTVEDLDVCNLDSFNSTSILMGIAGMGGATSSWSDLKVGDNLSVWMDPTDFAILSSANWFMKKDAGTEQAMAGTSQRGFSNYPGAGLQVGNYRLRVVLQKDCEDANFKTGDNLNKTEAEGSVSAALVSTVTKEIIVNFTITSNLCPDIASLAINSDDPKLVNSPVNLSVVIPGACVHTTTWNFGDNSPTAFGDSVSHPYSFPGFYSVNADVNYTNDGLQGDVYRQVVIGKSCPTVNDFQIAGPSVTTIGTSNAFSVYIPILSNCNLNVSNISYNFGDGTAAQSSNSGPSYNQNHTYGTSGVKTLTATVSFNDGKPAKVITKTVTVVGGPASCTVGAVKAVSISGPISAMRDSTLRFALTVPDCFVPANYNVNNITWSISSVGSSLPPGMSLQHTFGASGLYTIQANLLGTNFGNISVNHFVNVIDPVCTNGANNPPACNACTAPKVWNGSSCVDACTNGANNPPACNACTAPKVWNGSSCVDACTNGANNPPACNACTAPKVWNGSSCVNPCTNGANNPPTCNACTAPLVWNGSSCQAVSCGSQNGGLSCAIRSVCPNGTVARAYTAGDVDTVLVTFNLSGSLGDVRKSVLANTPDRDPTYNLDYYNGGLNFVCNAQSQWTYQSADAGTGCGATKILSASDSRCAPPSDPGTWSSPSCSRVPGGTVAILTCSSWDNRQYGSCENVGATNSYCANPGTESGWKSFDACRQTCQ